MKIYEVSSYPGKANEILVQKEQDLMPQIKEKLHEESQLPDTQIENLTIIAGTVIAKQPCFIKINDSGWLPLLEAGDYYSISFEDVSIKKIQFSDNVTLKTFAYYFL